MTNHSGKASSGKASNILLVFGVGLFLGIGLIGLGAFLASNKNFGKYLMAVYWLLTGGFIGVIIWGMRLRICRFVWSEKGFSFCIGWKRAIWHHFEWSDPVEFFLYSTPDYLDSKPGDPTFVFILLTQKYEIRVDGLQMPRKSIQPFLAAIRSHRDMTEFPYSFDMIDQGPSIRLRPTVHNLAQTN